MPSVTGTDKSVSYDAHPMAILTSAFAYLGSYYSEANPSLRGTDPSFPMKRWIEHRIRPEVIHQRRCAIFGNDRQADIPTDWQSHNPCCVSTHPTCTVLSLTRVTPAWRIEFVKGESSLPLLPTSVTLDREPLVILRFRCSVDPRTTSFLFMMDHMGEEDYVPNPVLEKALDVLFLLHADHELNASCTTVLQTASSLVDPYSAIAYVFSIPSRPNSY